MKVWIRIRRFQIGEYSSATYPRVLFGRMSVVLPVSGIHQVIARHQSDDEAETPVKEVGNGALRENPVAQAALLRVPAVPLVVNDGVSQQGAKQETRRRRGPKQYVHVIGHDDPGKVHHRARLDLAISRIECHVL